MKILHTSDFHLTEEGNSHFKERWKGLRAVIKAGISSKVNLMVISGDLFDSNRAGDSLRTAIRSEFEKASFPIVIIPGNHDAESYSESVFFGENVTVINSLFKPVQLDGVSVWGFPYRELTAEKILLNLHRAAGMVNKNIPSILLLHGELLDISGVWENYGNEGVSRYFPVKLSYFKDLPWGYVLAGHFHTNFDIKRYRDNGYFVYSGSPVSITEKEVGVRKVNIFEIGKAPSAFPVESFYYEDLSIKLDPLEVKEPLKLVKEKLLKADPNAALLVKVEGYFNGRKYNINEKKLAGSITELLKEKACRKKVFEFRDIGEILEDETYREFVDRLNEISKDDEEKSEIENLMLRAMMEAD